MVEFSVLEHVSVSSISIHVEGAIPAGYHIRLGEDLLVPTHEVQDARTSSDFAGWIDIHSLTSGSRTVGHTSIARTTFEPLWREIVANLTSATSKSLGPSTSIATPGAALSKANAGTAKPFSL